MERLMEKQFGNKAADDMQSLAAYSSDASQIRGEAVAVVRPETLEDVHKLIRYCIRTGATITPRGGGTGLAGGAVPKDSVVMDMSRMDRIISIEPNSRAVTVEPGVIPAELNRVLQKYGLIFPVMPASHKICTIGGMIATDAAGFRSLKDGNMRGWVEEIEVLDGMGRHYNVKGDNIDAFCGTEGTVGIITKARLRLTEPYGMRSLDLFKLSSFSEMLDVIGSLDMEKVTRAEYMDRVAARIAGLEMHYYLFIEYNDDTGQMYDEAGIENTWKIRENATVILADEGYGLIEDPKLANDKLPEFIEWLEMNDIPSFGHICEGIVHPQFRSNDLIPQMHELVRKLEGIPSAEHGIGLRKKQYTDVEYKQRIKALKKRYDPQGILNPDKLI